MTFLFYHSMFLSLCVPAFSAPLSCCVLVSHCICLSTSLSPCVPVSLRLCLSVFLSLCVSVSLCPSLIVCVSLRLCLCACACVSLSLIASVCLCLTMCLCVSLRLPACYLLCAAPSKFLHPSVSLPLRLIVVHCQTLMGLALMDQDARCGRKSIASDNYNSLVPVYRSWHAH